MKKNLFRLIFMLFIMVPFVIFNISASAEALPVGLPPGEGDPEIEIVSPYLATVQFSLPDGTEIIGSRINGPPEPPPEFEEERLASILPLPNRGIIASFPSYAWVFGCSAVSGAMISAYYDNNSYTNMYTGPTNGGAMPLTDTSWPTWMDSSFTTYPNNPLIASHNGVDGRTTRGSIDDYWIQYGSSATDPFITNGWVEHTWGSAIGDYMKTSQSSYSSTDGSTWFYNNLSNSKLTCTAMESTFYIPFGMNVSAFDGTYGRKLFFEARGYTVNDCYNQKTDNKYTGGFSLADFQAEIDAGHPVLLNLEGHSIVGYGYSGSTIYIRDTWDNDPNNTYTMTWGGSYSGMVLDSVSVVKLDPPPSPPSAPTGVSASDGIYTTDVEVSWNASSGATYYKVFRNTSNTHAGETTLTSSHGASPFDDTSAVPGTTYYYWVKACVADQCSDYSIFDTGWRDSVPLSNYAFLPLITGGTGASQLPLSNGGFESGQDGSWTEYSTHGWDIIMPDSSSLVTAHGGAWLAWLGGDYDDTSYISQTVTIPSGMPYLHFWFWIASEDVCGFDTFWLKVGSTTIGTLELCEDNDTLGWAEAVADLSGYSGSIRSIKFEVTTDSSLNSNFFLDDISFSGSASASISTVLPEGVNLDFVSNTRSSK